MATPPSRKRLLGSISKARPLTDTERHIVGLLDDKKGLKKGKLAQSSQKKKRLDNPTIDKPCENSTQWSFLLTNPEERKVDIFGIPLEKNKELSFEEKAHRKKVEGSIIGARQRETVCASVAVVKNKAKNPALSALGRGFERKKSSIAGAQDSRPQLSHSTAHHGVLRGSSTDIKAKNKRPKTALLDCQKHLVLEQTGQQLDLDAEKSAVTSNGMSNGISEYLDNGVEDSTPPAPIALPKESPGHTFLESLRPTLSLTSTNWKKYSWNSTTEADLPSTEKQILGPVSMTIPSETEKNRTQPLRELLPNCEPYQMAGKRGQGCALQPFPNFKSKELLDNDQKPKKLRVRENFIRLNLRNNAGACRGARNKRSKSKTSQIWEAKRKEREEESNSKNSSGRVVPCKVGVDPLDDYLDEAFIGKDSAQPRKDLSIPLCSGHQLPCKQLVVKKSTSENKGRHFYCCSFPRGEQCNFFEWADDTKEAARNALEKNSSMSFFVARQVANFMERFRSFTVPELKELLLRHNLDHRGKKEQLLMRLKVWVRDEIAKGSKLEGELMSDIGDDSVSSSSEDLEFFDRESEDEDSTCESSFGCRKNDEAGDEVCRSTTDGNTNLLGPSDRNKDATDLRLRNTLREVFGYDSFREGQEWAIRRAMDKQRTLLVAPTGFGKSLCYALPSLLLDGVCIVVSPLLALIEDQIRVLPPRLTVATLSGSLTSAAVATIVDDIVRGRIKVLFVSPERLASSSFRRLFKVQNIAGELKPRKFPLVSLLCVDEAHCLSQWAHNFRPSYLRMQTMLQLIEPQSVLAMTATAGPRVVTDICTALSINNDGGDKCGVRTLNANRENIDVACHVCTSQEQRLTKLISLLMPRESSKTRDADESDEGFLSRGSVIVYVWRQRDAEAVAESIEAAGVKGGVVVYHGGMDHGLRQRAQNKFLRGKSRICVATVAFGLGINKSDVVGVVHLYLTASPEHYLQEIGRAGRDGSPAKAIALILEDEVCIRHSLAHSDMLSRSQVFELMKSLADSMQRSLAMLPPDKQRRTSFNIALPLDDLVTSLGCKAESIETIVSMLEVGVADENGKHVLHIEGQHLDRVSIAPKRRKLEELAKREQLVEAIIACGKCVEAPVGETALDPLEARSSLVGYAHGVYTFSVSECANYLGEAAEPRHVFACLRRLERSGEIQLSLDNTRLCLALKVSASGMSIFGESLIMRLEDITTTVVEQIQSTVLAAASKVLDIDFILKKVSQVQDEKHEGLRTKSRSLMLFQELVGAYLQEKLSFDECWSPGWSTSINPGELVSTAQSVMIHLADLDASTPAGKKVVFGDPHYGDYSALTITKFLHGIQPSRYSLSQLRSHPSFGSLQHVRFDTLYEGVRSLLNVND